MDVLLMEDVPGKGALGDVIRVKEGYFRNYLQPRGMAAADTPANHRVLEDRRRAIERRAARELDDAKAQAKVLEELTLTFTLTAGENDRLFGSVTNADIAEALAEQGYDVDRRRIVMDEAIKTLGIYTVHVRLRPEVETHVKVLVEKK